MRIIDLDYRLRHGCLIRIWVCYIIVLYMKLFKEGIWHFLNPNYAKYKFRVIGRRFRIEKMR